MNNDRAIVLIIEDDQWIRKGMKRSVEALGFRVMVAENGEEAVAAAESVHPHLILTEEDVPDFYELTKRLREHPVLHNVPIVIVNPDAEYDTRYGDAIVLTDYYQLERLQSCKIIQVD
ncbi:MAG TPA: response regulator [Pyrinomonadaceae bacterium]|nr:response regulator [Pyrinomonadaceae bacterium]